jgi:hypothetical protein
MGEGQLPQKKRALARPRSSAVGLRAELESFYTDFLKQLEPQECRGIVLRKQTNAVAYCAISLPRFSWTGNVLVFVEAG